jgi:pilus assembly protein CpaF
MVGEVRGPEALDMLQAMNTGHDGSMTTVHANSVRDVFHRIETMVLMANMGLSDRVIRQQVASAIHLVVHTARLHDATRRVMSIAEVTGLDEDGVAAQELFVFERLGVGEGGRALGRFRATGVRPQFLETLRTLGIHLPDRLFSE